MKPPKYSSLRSTITLLLWGLVLILPLSVEAQEEIDGTLEDYYNVFADVQPSTGYLLNLGFPEVDDLNFCTLSGMTGDDCGVQSGPYLWRSWYEKLRVSAKSPTLVLPDLDTLTILSSVPEVVVPVGVIYLNGNHIPIDTLGLYADTVNSYVPPNTPSEIVNVFSIANLKSVVYQPDVTFELSPELIFSNIDEEVQSFEVDFGDGLGFQSMSFEFFTYTVSYPNKGQKSIIFKLHTANKELISYSRLEVSSRDCFYPNFEGEVSIGPPPTSLVLGEYSIVYGCDGVFDRPVIIVEGFDPFLTRTTTDVCNGYSQFWDHAKERGLDLVSVKFRLNHAPIQFNAQILEAIIRQINSMKEGNFESVIIAESMGGLISRIALAEMEQGQEDHQVRLYTSFDSPHNGANIPLSIQHVAKDVFEIDIVRLLGPGLMLKILSFDPDLPANVRYSEIPDLVTNMFEAPAARQMLIRHLQKEREINPEHLSFRQLLDSIGFPEVSRNIALINGGRNGNWQQTDSGPLDTTGYYFDLSEDKYGGFFKGTAWTKVSPTNADSVQVSQIKIKIFWFIKTTDKRGYGWFFSKAYDIAPGGLLGEGDIRFSFVPVFSSIALDEAILQDPESLFLLDESSGEYLRSIRGLVENGWTPFDNIYAGPENTGHVSLNSINELFNQFCRQEIMMDSFFIQNREFTDEDILDFHAYDLMRLGREVDPWQEEKIISSGEVAVKEGAVVNVSADRAVNLRPGFSAQAGSCFSATIQAPPTCDPADKADNSLPSEYANLIIFDPVIDIKQDEYTREVSFTVSNLFTDPEKTKIEWTITGDDVYQKLNPGQHQKIIDLPPGQYAVNCSLFGGARSTSKVFVVRAVPAVTEEVLEQPIPASPSITLYPNPTQNTLQWAGGQTYQLSLYDTQGRLVREQKNVQAADLSGLPAGPYAIVLRSRETGEVIKQIIIKE